MDLKQFKEVPVVVYGNLERYSETISKGRCRIFYKGMNRNGTYITPEFAEKLVSTLPYTPIKGIYDNFNEDYTDHGHDRNLGRIYGVVPADPHFAWEAHLDEDGVEREYACVDVYIYTALYDEANEIIGKSQSMEIYEPSIKGEWMTIEGQRAFVFTDGCFLGLQVLGDEVEPCFEGAAFFSLYKSLKDLVDELGTYERKLNNPESNKGGQTMFDIFRLSDDAKYNMIFDLLNPNFNEEGNWEINYMITDVYDDYALAFECKKKHYERVYYSKNDAEESVTLGDTVEVYIVDVTAEEKTALATIQALNGGTYELIDENLVSVEAMNAAVQEKVEEFSATITENEQKIEELNGAISTLETEKEEINNQYTEATQEIEKLNTEVEALNEFKLQVETNAKEAVIEKYAIRMDEEILAPYREKIADYTVETLDRELAFELVNSTPSIFELEQSKEGDLIPKNTNAEKSSLELILDGYKNK